MRKIDNVQPDQVVEELLKIEDKLETEIIEVRDALNRVVAEDIFAKYPVPHFDKSPYDGFAFRGEDTLGASKDNPVKLEIIEEIPAGHFPKFEIGKNQAAKILTGGPLPKGANVCYKYEKTEFDDSYVSIFEEIKPNKDIIRKGEDTKEGALIVERGSLLDIGSMGQLHSQGIGEVKVYKKKTIGFFTTGSELLTQGEELLAGKIYDSNSVVFTNLFKKLGFEVLDYGIVDDDLKAIEEKTQEIIEEVDLLVTTGGASVGDYDYAVRSIENIGGEVLIWKSDLKPGGSVVISRLREKTVFGLSGNPASALISLYRLGLPYLYKISGRKEIYPKKIDMIFRDGYDKKSAKTRLLRGHLEYEDGKVYFIQNRSQGNGVLSSFVNCDAFIEIPGGSDRLPAGTMLKGYKVGSLFGNIGE